MIEFVQATFPLPLHPFAEKTLEDSFPEEERPDILTLRSRNTPRFHLDVILQDKHPVGILTHWDFPGYTYIEHFAIEASRRNNHIGSETLRRFMEGKRRIILEAEPPESPIAIRRLKFYQRHGLTPLPYEYRQPSYREEGNGIPLLILSNIKITSDEFGEIKNTLYKEVYKVL